MREFFRKFAERVSLSAGSPGAFVVAVAIIAAWLVSGPIFRFSNTWQLIINTGTTIVTFLMVFLLQNTATRESRATQIKLDELLRAVRSARTSLVDLEELPDEELDRLEHEFREISDRAGATRLKRKGTQHEDAAAAGGGPARRKARAGGSPRRR